MATGQRQSRVHCCEEGWIAVSAFCNPLPNGRSWHHLAIPAAGVACPKLSAKADIGRIAAEGAPTLPRYGDAMIGRGEFSAPGLQHPQVR